ncbi:MAG: restriction endonuclease subunit S [Proteobacteria bacterium]|jgi:type I restriction enzyme S subunit|nr:restriction endonuclease subunit S [Pseudomonadota bacterium]
MIGGLKPYPQMKDSGVPWLGEVPEHWEVRPICGMGSLFKGSGGNKDDEVPAGIPCVRYGDLYTRHEFFITKSKAYVSKERSEAYTPIRHGDVLFAASGETEEDIGRSSVNLIDGEARCGGDVLVLRPEVPAVPRYLGYAADSPASRRQKACMGRGFTVVHIYGSQLKRLVLPLPPLPEQAAIVRFLDHADRRIRCYIRAKQKLIKLLEEQKQAVIHRAVTRGLDPNVRLKPSGVEWLGDVPEHWDVARLGRHVELVTGFPFKSDGFTQDAEDIRLLRGVNISPGRLRWADVVRWPLSERDKYVAYDLQVGDIVLGMDRPIIQSGTRVATVSEPDVPALLLQRVARIRPRDELQSEFLTLLLAGKSFADYLTPIFTGISVPHLSPEQIKSFRFALPPNNEQRAIVQWTAENTRKTDVSIANADRKIQLLREYRTSLIADVVTGKLDVREAAARLPQEAEEPEPLDEAEALGEVEGESTADDLDPEPQEAEA